MVIFGATGDLTQRKLLPAIVRLEALGMLPKCFNIVGLSSRALTTEGFREHCRDALKEFSPTTASNKKAVEGILNKTSFIESTFEDPAGYQRLARRLDEIDAECKGKNSRLYYLATPPSAFPVIIDMLHKNGLSMLDGPDRPKIIIEKPFGKDQQSAAELNELVLGCFDESQVYRIDHYLGKETVQNILFFRFANSVYEPIWNSKFIDHVQITVAEEIGVGGRGRYFEEAGCLRDMVQNHMLQLLALVAMEPPITMNADDIRDRKIDLLRSLREIGPDEVRKKTVRGQYNAGTAGGELVAAYRSEEGVAPDSTTETFVAMEILIDNWRWSGVPFYLRTGKRLKKRVTEISIHFRPVPHCMFTSCMTRSPDSNVLALKIQPDEGITFRLDVKRPGTSDEIETVDMNFSYYESFKVELPEAYERLLYDCMVGDATLFPHRGGIEASWSFITNVLKGWETMGLKEVSQYAPGSWGPDEANGIIETNGRVWRNL